MLYFVGRKDRRVKLLGHQVDLTLIEDTILTHTAVKNCLVFTNDSEIIALIESNAIAAENLSAEMLKTILSRDLPSHMMPNDFRFVTQLPLSSHGKFNRSPHEPVVASFFASRRSLNDTFCVQVKFLLSEGELCTNE